ncbi:MAG: hypothetical protein NTV23_00215 [Propionibacteriales bacterium]|nr:hypothetical protein [Propionibacteriales bacterium]
MTLSPPDVDPTTAAPSSRAAWTGLGLTAALIATAMVVPSDTFAVFVQNVAPLNNTWDPRVGVGTVPAVLIALIGTRYAIDAAQALPWRHLLAVVYGTGLAWMLSLAFVDGRDGVGAVLTTDGEYLKTARLTTDLPYALATYTERIPYDAPLGNLPEHLAGHPPGALTFFVLLDRLGLSGGFTAGMVVTLIAATTAVAVLVTLRVLAAESLARRAAPFLVLGPAALWACVSGDGMFSAVAAWGLCALALAATRESPRAALGWSVLSGLLLGYTVMLSYGLPLLGLLAIAILVAAGSWRPLVPAALAASAVVLVYAAYGFAWWEAIGVLRERYWDGVASQRPTRYWIWADLACLLIAAGPLLGAGLAQAYARARSRVVDAASDPDRRATRVVLLLSGAATAIVVIADLSLMSKAEVERIWLPFMPWLLLSCALLPERWRRRGLVLQVVTALAIGHLTTSLW